MPTSLTHAAAPDAFHSFLIWLSGGFGKHMDDIKQDLTQLVDHAINNWRTTLNGILEAAIAIIVAIVALPPDQQKIVYLLAALRALVGVLQKDCTTACLQDPNARV